MPRQDNNCAFYFSTVQLPKERVCVYMCLCVYICYYLQKISIKYGHSLHCDQYHTLEVTNNFTSNLSNLPLLKFLPLIS